MATAVCGAVLVLALTFALRHVYRNFISGKGTCACTCEDGKCSGCKGN